MELSEYQEFTKKTAMYPVIGYPIIYPTLGLAGEVGELSEKVKKAFRDGDGISDERRAALAKELGDVLWYVSQVATELGVSLDDVAKSNIEKLEGRLRRGTIQGDGDDR